MEYYSSTRKNEILPFAATWMDFENIMLTEISQTEKDKYCMILLICGIWKYNKVMNKTKKKLTYRYREQTSGYQCREGREEGVWDWHVHTAIFKMDNQQGPTV